MSTDNERPRCSRLSRRAFLLETASASCGVMFALHASQGTDLASGSAPRSVQPNSWVTLYPSGKIEIVAPGIELGQGSHTTLPRFLAEELDAEWSQVSVIPAPADEARYGNPLFWGLQITAGSRTCLGYFDVLRLAGAQARYVLLTAAASRWRCPLTELQTASSVITHQPTGRRLTYAQLVPLARVPAKFPEFIATADRPQLPDDFFGDPAPSPVAPRPGQVNALRLKTPDQYRLIGRDSPRIDIPAKVSGAARYGIDLQVPAMLHAMVETGPVLGDVPDRIDDATARRVPGVTDIVRLPYGVAVVGSSLLAVQTARPKLQITWQSGTRRKDYDSERTLEDFSRIASDPAGHPGKRVFQHGDAAQGAVLWSGKSAGVTIHTFEGRSELVYHAPLEPQNAILRLSDDGRSAEAWLGTQWPKVEQDAAAKILGIPAQSIKIHVPYVGGSFGRRQEAGAIIDAAYLVKVLRRPVQVIWTRQDDLKRNPFRQALVCRAEAAVDGRGNILAMRHRVVADSWFARLFPDWFAQYNQSDPGNWVGALSLYDIPIQAVDAITERRGVDVCYMRGIGVTQTKFAQECLIDQLAAAHRTDPLQYRLRLLQKVPRGTQVVRDVAEMSHWGTARPGHALGIAYTPYSNSHAALVAEVSLDNRTGVIRVHNVWSCIDAGPALQPDIIRAQMEGGIVQGLSMALLERVTLRNGIVEQSNFDDYPVLRMSQTPQIDVRVLSTDNAVTGVAEIGVMQIAPAVNNAVAKLIGTHLGSMPMLPAQVLAALHAKPRSRAS